jgi:hypothetical protein
MELNQNPIVLKNENFSDFLANFFGQEYGLGIHGIENSECWIKQDGTWQLNTPMIEQIKDAILTDGLNIKGNRTLLSTVRFDRFDDYLTSGYYDAGGIIVALPKTIKNSNGDHYFVGYPIESTDMIDRNYTFSSLSDMFLPEFSETQGRLNPMFVLAKYEKVDDESIKLTMNPKHIYFNAGLLPNEYFNIVENKIIQMCNSYGCSNLDAVIAGIYEKNSLPNIASSEERAIVNTAHQFNNTNARVK